MKNNRARAGFSLVEMMISIAVSAVLMLATYAVVASVIKGDEESRVRVELQLEAASALRKISDLLKMTGPTGTVGTGWVSGNYPVFAADQAGGGFPAAYAFLNTTTYQTPPASGPNSVTNEVVARLAPATDTDGYYGPSNEIAFQLPRPSPWYYPASPPAGKSDNAVDDTGVPVNLTGQVTWGVTPALYSYYQTSPSVVGASTALADRQADVYAIVLVPTTSFEKDAAGVAVAGPNQLELREFSSANSASRYLIRKTVLAYNVERITFSALSSSTYYLTGSGTDFRDANLGMHQLKVTLWMWKNDMNKKNRSQIQAFRAKQSITVNLRSVGQNQN